MSQTIKTLYPFHCIAADCEDTCCRGWQVVVDREAYASYINCRNPELGALLRKAFIVNEGGTSEADYARIDMNGGACPLLEGGLCKIQALYGQDFLMRTCRFFPGCYNRVDGVLEKTLDLACPEAARIVLFSNRPVRFHNKASDEKEIAAIGEVPELYTAGEGSNKPYQYFFEIREFMLALIQNRRLSLEDRLVVLGLFCRDLDADCAAGQAENTPALIRAFERRLETNGFEGIIKSVPNEPGALLKVLATLIEYRLRTGAAGRRFAECFEEFGAGLGYGSGNPDERTALAYREAQTRYYRSCLAQDGLIFENYFINYILGTLFPLGPQRSLLQKRMYTIQKGIFDEYVLLAAQYAMLKVLLTGMAACHKDGFKPEHIVRLVQSFVKNIAHDTEYQKRILQFFRDNNMNNIACLAVMIKN
jgi:lysine-N-methylase